MVTLRLSVPVPERVQFKLCGIVCRCLHGLGPAFLSGDFMVTRKMRDQSKSQPTDDKITPEMGVVMVTWLAHFKFLGPQSYIWNG